MIMTRIKTLVAAAVLVQGTLRAADGGAEGKVGRGIVRTWVGRRLIRRWLR
jgi:hypothetical protein